MDDVIVRGSAWLSMAALAGYAALKLRRSRTSGIDDRLLRWFWTAGCALLWVHTACAFHFRHHWSHAAAYSETARQTAEMVGRDWGGGLYFNYFMLIVWTADVAWEWCGPQSYRRRPAPIGWLVYGFVAFMAFNATVVFGSGALRGVALATSAALGVWALRRRRALRS